MLRTPPRPPRAGDRLRMFSENPQRWPMPPSPCRMRMPAHTCSLVCRRWRLSVAPPAASATHAPRRSEHPVHEGRRARVIASTRVGHGATHIDIINRKCTDRLKCSVQGAAPCNSPHAQALQLVQSRRHREKLDLPQVFLFDIAVQLRGCRRLRVPSPHQRHVQPAALRSLSTF